ncbi:sulfotransferase family protein [Nitzschia inconspicua]|uniref:Sulfotransferase family protein n=1 Tax=Nitzschia inconspicua TaxID=303405 RepID=A0A9K3LCK2_9STRA|nr:sulfotransferase family protein [Nitzschia inconspicua]
MTNRLCISLSLRRRRVSVLMTGIVMLLSIFRSNWNLLSFNDVATSNYANLCSKETTQVVKATTHNSTQHFHDNTTSRSPSRLLFALHPQEMVDTFATCAVTKTCHVLYWHIQKTGGTNLADRLYFMNGQQYQSKFWCCHGDFMRAHFWPDPQAICQKKFGVYEVRPHQYQEVIQTCQQLPSMQNDTFIGLVTIRQPFERTVSDIHQRCNVHPEQLNNASQEICRRCDYSVTEDRHFYDKIVNTTNTIFEGIRDIWSKTDTFDLPLLFLDNTDIDTFLHGVERIATQQMHQSGHLPPNESFHFRPGRSNSQASRLGQSSNDTAATNKKSAMCEFGMTSSMMKQHATSLQIYRWIQHGRPKSQLYSTAR